MTEKQLRAALQYAILVIEGYQLEIRSSDDPSIGLPLAKSLADYGFCQGSIYLTAVETIRAIAAGEKQGP